MTRWATSSRAPTHQEAQRDRKTALAESYPASWHETDATSRRTAIDATIAAVQMQFPGFVFRLAAPVNSHHDLCRFTWGSDRRTPSLWSWASTSSSLMANGRLQSVTGFFDKVPP
jgi:hypothetical protein